MAAMKVDDADRRLVSQQILTEEQLAALGSVVAESTYLESLVDIVIGRLAHLTKPQRVALLRKAMFQSKLEIMAELAEAKLKSVSRKKKFAVIVSRLKAANSTRVNAVHGIWWHTSTPLTIAQRGEAIALHPRSGQTKLAASNLMKVAEEISDVHNALFFFYAETWAAPARVRQAKRRRANIRAQIGLRSVDSDR
jgi:hypothetical protein